MEAERPTRSARLTKERLLRLACDGLRRSESTCSRVPTAPEKIAGCLRDWLVQDILFQGPGLGRATTAVAGRIGKQALP